ncbi:hypothetical protein P280DRAFT_309632 [Massarina eburnea CBS 473.64]|uniref:Uncharacterized protein n=1 Tax=Massarina eburnea CBS 473.64 TaxID=1395130 RepID=A0A6A6S0H5_9PLEO|nr:hypothetical protein P280DRAFT_309632 [Massarina eburnea CBS 473.64]
MARSLHYDQHNGQVYTQNSVEVTSMVSTWLSKSTGKKNNPSEYRNTGTGASSLLGMAMRSCAWNIDIFVPNDLVCAEWAYAEKIYEYLKSKDTVTLKNWALFHKAFPGSKYLIRTFTLPIGAKHDSPPLELEPIRRQLVSLTPTSLTNLELRNLTVRDTDLMALLEFPNLAVLVLEQSRNLCKSKDDGGIHDKFMSRWGRAVYDTKAFMKLKVILFRHFQTSLNDTLAGFTVFPKLALCNLDSFFAKQDMIGMAPGALVGARGRWRHLPTDCQSTQVRGQNPEITWRRSDKTVHEKMEMIYELAGKLLPRPETDALGSTLVSVHYGDSNRYYDRKSYSAWFVRVPPNADEYIVLPAKRPNPAGGAAAEVSQRPKKRVKSGKKQEIGALLGAFV